MIRRVVPFSTTTQSTQNSSLSPQHDSAWLDGLNSPLIQDEGDSKMLKLRFDVSQYTPEEIVVKTVDNKLLVSTVCVLLPCVDRVPRCVVSCSFRRGKRATVRRFAIRSSA